MGLETSFNYPSDLNASNPAAGDNASTIDEHTRGLKTCFKTTLPNVSGAITASHTELNILDGATLSTAELNYVDGVTSPIQTQINAITSGSIVGNWVQLNSTDISGTPTAVDLKHGTGGVVLSSTYDEYLITFSHVIPTTDQSILCMQTMTDATTPDTGASDYDWVTHYSSNLVASVAGDATDSKIELTAAEVGNASGETGVCGHLAFFSPSAAQAFNAQWAIDFMQYQGQLMIVRGSGRRVAAANVDGIRFLWGNGSTFASGNIKLFGRKL